MKLHAVRLAALAAAAAAAGLAATAIALPAAGAAPSHTQITGSGSSWAANAVNQWISDVNKQGLQVVFTSTGSAQGRKDFAYRTTDFGVSDIGYQGTDPVTGQQDSPNGRPYAYLPIVAGGTSFPYNLSYAGQRIRNLRLSGQTLAEIFTNKITYWDDKQIKADNNNKLLLPHIPIIPVVHSEGSGSTYQFTAYLARQYPSVWSSFAGYSNPTEYFPRKGSQEAQSGSDGVMNFITSSAGSGSIGFDEYSYALLSNFPVAKIENAAGYYTAPTQYNVAVALTKAVINQDKSSPNYLTQNLNNVYSYGDSRTYPMSSYSYMIIPTGGKGVEQKTTSTAQRQTIADFLYYSICQGQSEMGPIGYSPLPVNLVQDGFGQIAKLKQADSGVDLTSRNVTTCHNPTFIAGQPSANHLAKIAPQPPACDKQGAGPCGAGVGVVTANPGSNGKAPTGGSAAGGTAGSGGAGGGSAAGSGGQAAAGAGGAAATAGAGGAGATGTHIDPNTGQVVSDGGAAAAAGTAGTAAGGQAEAQPVTLAAEQTSSAFSALLYVLAVVLLLGVLVAPVLFNRFLTRRAGSKP
ncbi:substrate-binding domain-containing protein [uncultured Jatrophihabitans sp.]|uniref:substrate-binding domain-containing protein n=1 Tax=uncultured Jatrophihabitans sp. TaxID=1610747 RepID=UPI0035CB6428